MVILKEPLLSDEATDNATKFGFKDYSELLNTIIRDSNLKTPFVIAIYGAWGSGKTSLMKTVSKKLDIPNSDLVTVKTIWFSAWEFEKLPTPLWTVFLNRIIMELQEMLPNEKHKKQIKAIGSGLLLLSTDILMSRIIGIGMKDLEKIKEKVWKDIKKITCLREDLSYHINQALDNDTKGRKRLVIFIDDLDRCLANQCVEIFESIKLFLDCENCVFVIGVDKEQIQRIFLQEFGTRGEEGGLGYVEKFVQLEFELPPKTPDEVKEFMLANAPKTLQEDPETVELISQFIEPNPRRIKRWLNSVLFLEKLFRLKQESIEGYSPSFATSLASIWLFLKASYPNFATLIASEPEALNTAIEIAGDKSDKEKSIDDFKLEESLVDFLSRLEPVFEEKKLMELIHLSRYTPKVELSRESIASGLINKLKIVRIEIEMTRDDFDHLITDTKNIDTPISYTIIKEMEDLLNDLNNLITETKKADLRLSALIDRKDFLNIFDEREFKSMISDFEEKSADIRRKFKFFQKVIQERQTGLDSYQNKRKSKGDI